MPLVITRLNTNDHSVCNYINASTQMILIRFAIIMWELATRQRPWAEYDHLSYEARTPASRCCCCCCCCVRNCSDDDALFRSGVHDDVSS